MTPEMVVAITGLLGSAIGFLGWRRETKKDKSTERRSDLDVVLSGYQQLLKDKDASEDRTKAEIAAAMTRAIDCERREQALIDKVKAMDVRVQALEGAIRGN